jgi:hypothetical protein
LCVWIVCVCVCVCARVRLDVGMHAHIFVCIKLFICRHRLNDMVHQAYVEMSNHTYIECTPALIGWYTYPPTSTHAHTHTHNHAPTNKQTTPTYLHTCNSLYNVTIAHCQSAPYFETTAEPQVSLSTIRTLSLSLTHTCKYYKHTVYTRTCKNLDSMTMGTLPIGSIFRSQRGSLIEFCDDAAPGVFVLGVLLDDELASVWEDVARGPLTNARALAVMKKDVDPHAACVYVCIYIMCLCMYA